MKRIAEIIRYRHRDQRGITGLETAIILIAFVTVAAVFGYAVLSAGIFSAEKGKETVYTGLQEARSTMKLVGNVIATGNTTAPTPYVSAVKYTIGNSLSGEPIDLTPPPNNKAVCSYIDSNSHESDITWSCAFVSQNDGDNLLETGEKAEITVDLSGLGTKLVINQQFIIEFKPSNGAVITFERTVPVVIDNVMDLH
jgi:flagellin FlaB